MAAMPRSIGPLLLAVVALGATAGARRPAQPAEVAAAVEADPPAWPQEFPAMDRLLYASQRNAAIRRRRAQQLATISPTSLEAIELQIANGSLSERVEGLRALLDRAPERLAPLLESIYELWYRDDIDPVRGTKPVEEVVAAMRKRLPDLPHEVAARLEYRLLPIDHFLDRNPVTELSRHYETFLQSYGDTPAGELAEIDLVETRERDAVRRAAPLDRLAAAHPGTVVAARALYAKGFGISRAFVPAGADPLQRFTQVLDVVRELASGRYPQCEWTDKAPDLIIQFQTFKPSYAPGTVDRMLESYQAFAADYLMRSRGGQADDALTFFVGTKMGDLFETRGDRIEATEAVFADLARLDPPRARYLQAEFYIARMRNVPADRALLFAKARDTLTALHATAGPGLYPRKALAALATLYYFEGDYADARVRYGEYASTYPQSEYAWVAALRRARADERLGNTAAARATYRAVAAGYPDVPAARVLGAVYAARASEALGDFAAAAGEYQRAVDDGDRWQSYSLNERRQASPADRAPDLSAVDRAAVVDRIADLTTIERPGGAALARGRWLLEHGQLREAIATFADAAAALPPDLAPEAPYLARRARVQLGLTLGDAESAAPDHAAAMREFDLAAEGAYDFGVTAARIAKASTLWIDGEQRDADALMREALDEWRSEQRRRPAPPLGAIEQDVASIRTFLFTPTGSPVYAEMPRNGFSWPRELPPFLLVSTDVLVKAGDALPSRRSVPQEFPGIDNVLLVTTEQVDLLDRIITTLGGTRTRTPTSIMQVPNQPAGASRRILDLWNRHFPARPGHWSGWELLSYPSITSVEFLDADRTQALVQVTVGYGGGGLLLSRTNDGWSVTRTVGQWVM